MLQMLFTTMECLMGGLRAKLNDEAFGISQEANGEGKMSEQ
jgi:hypothetical protein